MRQLGFSIYLDHGTDQAIMDYIDLGTKYNFKRIFMCLLSLDKEKAVLDRFKKIVGYANSKGLLVIADVSGTIFRELELSIDDLSFFKDLGLSGIRLDYGFSAMEEAIMTQNTLGLKIELNMSLGASHMETIVNFHPNLDNLKGSHNFYPQRYSGLDNDHFIKCSKGFKQYNLYTSAFVNSKVARFGPWPVEEGLCTLEKHRQMDIKTQAMDLFSTDLIDEVIIANAFASEEDFKVLSELNPYRLSFDVIANSSLTELDKEIIEKKTHRNRGDMSSYFIRSSQTRADYKGVEIKPENAVAIKAGDVLINNSLYSKYSGELLLALRDMENDGKTNVVGRIAEDQIYLLDRIGANDTFDLKIKKAGL